MVKSTAAADFHSEIADRFFEKYAQHPDFQERFEVWTSAMKKYISSGSRVIDWGCGPGVFSLFLAKNGCQVFGLDGADNMISICQETARASKLSNIWFEKQHFPLDSIPDRFEKQDAIISSSVLEYIPEFEKTVEQISFLLKSGGFLLVSVPNRPSFFRFLEATRFQFSGKPAYFQFVKNRFSPAEFHEIWARKGFDLKEIVFYGGNNFITKLTDLFLPKRFSKTLFLAIYQKK
jgi:2-polyprenyl-3-methyl-5-hydroxy-6-metoxy-1,4-benzoquinol methylase